MTGIRMSRHRAIGRSVNYLQPARSVGQSLSSEVYITPWIKVIWQLILLCSSSIHLTIPNVAALSCHPPVQSTHWHECILHNWMKNCVPSVAEPNIEAWWSIAPRYLTLTAEYSYLLYFVKLNILLCIVGPSVHFAGLELVFTSSLLNIFVFYKVFI